MLQSALRAVFDQAGQTVKCRFCRRGKWKAALMNLTASALVLGRCGEHGA